MGSAKPRRNGRTVLLLLGILAGMGGLTAASVPLYRLFCQVTGYGGTTGVAETAPVRVIDRTMVIHFNTDVSPALPWSFHPGQREVVLKVGETGHAYFQARNLSDKPLTGTAVFNVTPQKVGAYFNKIACFCFTKQRLAPGEEARMPVTFFVDPEIMNDPDLNDVKTITLSYTFYPAQGADEGAPSTKTRRTAAVSAN